MDRAVTDRTVTRAAASMGAATAASRLLGFVRVLVVAAVLGTTYLGNTFQGANSVSNVLFELVAAGALSAVLVPTFVDLLGARDHAELERLAGGLLGLAMLVLGVVSVIGVVAAPWLATVLTSGADPTVAGAQRGLATFLLRFFVPQVLLYAWAAVAIAVLQARRRFTVGAVAPIGNTVVMVAWLVAFRVVAGADPGLDLDTAEKLLLAAAGTLGVVAFVAIPVGAMWRDGVRPRLHLPRRDPAIRRVLALSGWAVLLHVGIGVLLGAAIVAGNRVAGGVVAYQVAWVFFLAPYAVLAQPVFTAVLPELADAHRNRDSARLASTSRWALATIGVLVVPVSALMVATAEPVMRVVAFGGAVDGGGVSLMAVALGSLAVGLFPYGAFLLLTRTCYAMGDSRTPALVAVVTSIAGALVTVVVAALVHGRAVVAVLGLAHSGVQVVATLVLGVILTRRLRGSLFPVRLVPVTLVSVLLGVVVWWVVDTFEPAGRLGTIALLAVVTAPAAGLYLLALRAARSWRGAEPSPTVAGATGP